MRKLPRGLYIVDVMCIRQATVWSLLHQNTCGCSNGACVTWNIHRLLKDMVQEVLKCTHDIDVPLIVIDGF